MQRLVTFRQGDRAEYLAQYILSSFAISVPVPRQEDVGTDFHCSLLKKDGKNLRPYLPFNIQIKSLGENIRREGLVFGGTTEGGNWRRHEIEQLCQADTPFLLGLVDGKAQRLDLFSTASRYFARTNWTGKGLPRELVLMPYTPTGEDHLGDGNLETLDYNAEMPLHRWTIPIGQPIVQISIDESEDPDRCEEIKLLLEPYLKMDQRNAVLSRLGLGYFEWPLIIRTNKPSPEVGIGLSYGPPASPGFDGQMEVLTKMVASILGAYKGAKMKDKILPWLNILDQLPLDKGDPLMKRVIEDASAYAKS